jgi:DNA-binding transcriptional ArsR family regulator
MSRSLVDGIDRVLHEPARLVLMGLLAVVDEADFVFLVDQTGLSPGNAGSHLKRLEDAGYVAADKRTSGNRPQTVYRLTADGRKAAAGYRRSISKLVEALPVR